MSCAWAATSPRTIVRTTEAAASRAAHVAGVSPRVHYADSNALVIGFVERRTLKPEDVRAPENHARLVDLIKPAHREIPKHFRGPAPLFWVFQVVHHYDLTLREIRSPHVSALTAFARMAERLEQAVGPIDIVFGHNDMLAANLLDDGERLWLVRLGICRIQFAAFRPGRSRLEQRSLRRSRRTHDGALFRAPDRS
jgi:thiamine kinase-like enzyme